MGSPYSKFVVTVVLKPLLSILQLLFFFFNAVFWMAGLAFNLGTTNKKCSRVACVWLFVVFARSWQRDKRTNSFISAWLRWKRSERIQQASLKGFESEV